MDESSTAARFPAALLLLLIAPVSLHADEMFEVTSFSSPGRSVAAEFAELNGDGRIDFFVVTLAGIPPEEKRAIRVYLQTPEGSFPAHPDHQLPVPSLSAVYDIADMDPSSPGEELVFLQPDGITLLSLADASGRSRKLAVPGPATMGLAEDERGLEQFKLIYPEFGADPWILVPQVGLLTALAGDGNVMAQVEVSRRANYFILPDTGLVSIESDFQVFLDAPKLTIGDVNGDRRNDIVSSTRHEIRVFLRQENGSYAREPTRSYPLRLITPEDHISGSGGVTAEVRDIDGDHQLDLLISHVEGGFGKATTTIYVYMNHDGGWNFDAPDQTIVSEASLGSNVLYDIDGDGRQELLRIELKFSVFEIIELLLTREIDVYVSIYAHEPGSGFDEAPLMKKKLSIPLSFDTFRPKGFFPTANVDLNADGFLDFMSSANGDAIVVHLGDSKGPFSKNAGRQRMSSAGVIRFGDLNQDRLPDFLIFDPHNFDVPVQVGRNLGVLGR